MVESVSYEIEEAEVQGGDKECFQDGRGGEKG
jgi:hypothetical protein